MTLKQVAEALDIHESTVSRSINGKYMQTPRGVFEIKYFFSSGVTGADGEGMSSNSIKSFIKERSSTEKIRRSLTVTRIWWKFSAEKASRFPDGRSQNTEKV